MKSCRPSISIVTPSFNQGQFLESCINSVLDQFPLNAEYIIVDGGSSDNSPEIIRRYESRCSKVFIEPDNGHADALNKGFAVSSGDIMCWLNSDDMYTPWAFKTALDIFERFPGVEWIQGIHGFWNSRSQLAGVSKCYKDKFDYLRKDYKWIQQESVFWRRSLWDRSGGYITDSYRYMVDGELWGRFFLSAELYNVESLFSGYRKHCSNRAHLNMAAVEAEMDDITSEMITQSSAYDRSVAKSINTFSRFVRSRTMANIPLQGIFEKLAYRILLSRYNDKAKYPLISWSNEANEWCLSYIARSA